MKVDQGEDEYGKMKEKKEKEKEKEKDKEKEKERDKLGANKSSLVLEKKQRELFESKEIIANMSQVLDNLNEEIIRLKIKELNNK